MVILSRILFFALFIFIAKWSTVECSQGERTLFFRSCLRNCTAINCTTQEALGHFESIQPWTEKMLSWNCTHECRYQCMWRLVDLMIEHNITIQQFYGKWPFVRLLGMQEPASVIFSILNGIAHGIGLWYYMQKVPSTNPLYAHSVGFGILAINAWIWSTVFHTRDFPLTEKLDYFCATATVLYSFYFCIYRMSFGLDDNPSTSRGKMIRIYALAATTMFYIYHVSYLMRVQFDYVYNMQANVMCGLSNGGAWLFYHWKTRKIYSHQWRVSAVICYTMVLVLLELMDFPPIFWIFDAHSLWHAGTIIIPAFWYRFLIDDSLAVSTKAKLP